MGFTRIFYFEPFEKLNIAKSFVKTLKRTFLWRSFFFSSGKKNGQKHRRTKNDKDSASLLRIHRTIQRKNTKFLRTKEKTRISSAFFALIQNFFLSLNVPLQTIGHAWAGIRGMPRFISGLEGHLRL